MGKKSLAEIEEEVKGLKAVNNEECCIRCVLLIAKDLNEAWNERKLAKFEEGMSQLLKAA